MDFNNFSKGVAGTLIIDTPRLCRFYVGSPVPLGPLAKGYVQLGATPLRTPPVPLSSSSTFTSTQGASLALTRPFSRVSLLWTLPCSLSFVGP